MDLDRAGLVRPPAATLEALIKHKGHEGHEGHKAKDWLSFVSMVSLCVDATVEVSNEVTRRGDHIEMMSP